MQPGTTLGSYAVTAKIGEGGMGEVYRARDTKLDPIGHSRLTGGTMVSASRSACTSVTLAMLCFLRGSDVAAQHTESIGDRLAITEQLAQYSYMWDSKDSVGFANLFTVDGVMERRLGGELVSGSRVVGRQAILAYAKESHQGRLADRQTRHHMSALVFLELSADRAVTENMALITHQTADDRVPFISGSGIYRNTWKKTDEGWRITERILFPDRFTGQ